MDWTNKGMNGQFADLEAINQLNFYGGSSRFLFAQEWE